MHDCISRGRAIAVFDPTSAWPTYGSGAAALGVATVTANPLGARERPLGALITFNYHRSGQGDRPFHLPALAAAVTDNLLGAGPPSASGAAWDAVGPADRGQDLAALLHCASGIVSVLLDCPPEDAYSIITAQAAASGQPVEAVVRAIIGAPRGLDP